MILLQFFPYAVALLEFGAAVVYAMNRQWALALAWFFYSLACIALANVK